MLFIRFPAGNFWFFFCKISFTFFFLFLNPQSSKLSIFKRKYVYILFSLNAFIICCLFHFVKLKKKRFKNAVLISKTLLLQAIKSLLFLLFKLRNEFFCVVCPMKDVCNIAFLKGNWLTSIFFSGILLVKIKPNVFAVPFSSKLFTDCILVIINI